MPASIAGLNAFACRAFLIQTDPMRAQAEEDAMSWRAAGLLELRSTEPSVLLSRKTWKPAWTIGKRHAYHLAFSAH
jgi:hypothetical protein